jgi:hypothetical protein
VVSRLFCGWTRLLFNAGGKQYVAVASGTASQGRKTGGSNTKVLVYAPP